MGKRPRPVLLAAAAVYLALTACKHKDLLDPNNVWDDLDPATPNKLRGVYQLIVEDGGLTTELHLRFTDGYVVGGVRCTPKNPKYPGLEAGDKAALGTNDLDAAQGRFSVDPLQMTKSADPILCEGGLVGDTYDFKVEELRLTLTRANLTTPLVYGKIGD